MASNHSAATSVIVPIRSLGPSHRNRIAAHLQALDADDRYLRFGYQATNEHIERYVAGLNFDRDDIFGIFNRKLELIAMAHLAVSGNAEHNSCAEFGGSVLKKARGRRYGTRLFERAVIHARNEAVAPLLNKVRAFLLRPQLRAVLGQSKPLASPAGRGTCPCAVPVSTAPLMFLARMRFPHCVCARSIL